MSNEKSPKIYIEVSFRQKGEEEPFEKTGTWNTPTKISEDGEILETGADYLKGVIDRHYDGECDCVS